MTYEELVNLPKKIEQAFILSPGYIGADSLDLERYIETVWKAPVNEKNYKVVAQSFRQWYKEHAPDEYHDPPSEFPGIGNGWGGPGRGGGRKTINPNGHTVARNVTFDPEVYRQVVQYATANGLSSFSAAINAMLSAI